MIQLPALRKLIVVQTRLYLREPVSVFFTLAFAPLLLVLMSFIFGNDPQPMFGGRGQIDVYVPTYAAIVIGVVGVISLPIEMAGRRESGALRRFRATPLRPITYLAGDVLVYFAMMVLGILLLFALGVGVYRVPFEGNVLALLAGVCLSAAAFLAVGYMLASLVPSVRVATVIGNVLFIPMMIFSGITMPLEMMPEGVRGVANFNPLTHIVTLLRGLWFGEAFGEHLLEVAVLGGVLVVGTAVAAFLWAFRWE